MRDGRSPFFVFLGFIIFIALMNGGLGAAMPFIIFFFVVNSLMSKNRRKKRTSRVPNKRYDRNRDLARRRADMARQRAEKARREEIRKRTGSTPRKPVAKRNPFKKSGIQKFKDYDYTGAIQDFEKALTIDPNDVAVHFNLGAAYSLDEDKEKSFYHLDKAVQLGFKDFNRINTHDALAYLRIQPEFEAFKNNGYRQGKHMTQEQKEAVKEGVDPKLLDQLNRLQELREKGVLTEEEFIVQKKKILR